MRKVLIPAVVFAWSGALAAAGPAVADVPISVDAHGGIRVSVRVNGAGPFAFLLDTGASRTTVADDLAGELGLPVVARTEIVTSAGTEFRPVVRLGTISIPPASMDITVAAVVPAAQFAALGPGVRGLLGQDFLSSFNYTLDYRHDRLRWTGPERCDGAGAVPLDLVEGRFVMSAADGHGRALRLVLDTGSEVAVLFHAIDSRSGAPGTTIRGLLAGDTGAQRATLSRLSFGSIDLHNLPVLIVERRGDGVDGLLPLHRFSSAAFAAGGACVVLRR